MTSWVGEWSRKRILELGALTEVDCAKLLRLLAEAPEKLWGEAMTLSSSRLFSVVEGDKIYTFSYAPLAFTGVGRHAGTLTLPGGRLILFLFDWGAQGLSGQLRGVRVSINAQQGKNARQHYITFMWDHNAGFSVRSGKAILRLRQAVFKRYGWCAFTANIAELRLMYFTQLFPQSVIQRLRALD